MDSLEVEGNQLELVVLGVGLMGNLEAEGNLVELAGLGVD